jgi:hypothetical protein
MKETVHILEFKKLFSKNEFNVKIKMFDLPFTIINKLMNEHLVYRKITFDIIVSAQLIIESKSNL